MKLKAPQGVGDPCVAGVIVESRDGVYEVEAEIGALLIECFGFVEVEADDGGAGERRAARAPRQAGCAQGVSSKDQTQWPRPISPCLPTSKPGCRVRAASARPMTHSSAV